MRDVLLAPEGASLLHFSFRKVLLKRLFCEVEFWEVLRFGRYEGFGNGVPNISPVDCQLAELELASFVFIFKVRRLSLGLEAPVAPCPHGFDFAVDAGVV